MKFSTGFFNGLFGKKATLQVPQDGTNTTRDVPVTVAWLNKMEAEGIITTFDMIPFHVIGPDGSETGYLRVDVDISNAQYQKLKDPKTGDLYGVTFYEKGAPKTTVIQKHQWELAKAKMVAIDEVMKRNREEHMKSLNEELKKY